MLNRVNYILFISMVVSGNHLLSQNEKKAVHHGNESYNSGKTAEAANYYRKSLKEKPDYRKANFNLGDALYKTALDIKSKKIKTPDPRMTPDSAANIVFDQAAEQFEVVAKSVSNADTIQKAWHNYGNARLQQKNYEDAVSAYKKALKINPKDEDTRYNLAYALNQLKKQQQQQGQNQQQQQQQQQQQKENQDKKEQKQPQPEELSKEQAEQILNALKNSEKKSQGEKKKVQSGNVVKPEKDW